MEPNPNPISPQEKRPKPKPIESLELKELLRSLGFKDENIEFEHSLGNLPTEEKQKIFEYVFHYFKSLDNKQKGSLKHLIEQGMGLKVNSYYEETLKDFSMQINDALRSELESSITNCNSFDELYEILNNAKGIKGIKFYYNSEKIEALKAGINKYRESFRKNLLENMTTAEGLRDKVQELQKLSPRQVATPIPEAEKIPEDQAPIPVVNEEKILEEQVPIVQGGETSELKTDEPTLPTPETPAAVEEKIESTPVAQEGEISKIPTGEAIPSGIRVIDVAPIPEKPLEINQEQPVIPEPQPVVPSPEPVPVVLEEKTPVAQEEKISDWKKSEEWKNFERMRNDVARWEAPISQLGMSSLGLELKRSEYRTYKEAIAKKIGESLRKEAGENLTPEKEAELNQKIHDTVFEELLNKERDSYKKTLQERRDETLTDKTKEVLKAALGTKTVQWYLKLPRLQRMAITTTLGTVVGVASGAAGALGVAGYSAFRISRAAASFGASSAGSFYGEKNKNWSLEELNKKEQKDTEVLKNSNKSLEEKSKEFEEIKNNYEKLRRSAALKKATLTVGLGAGMGLLAGLSEHLISGTGSSSVLEHADRPKTSAGQNALDQTPKPTQPVTSESVAPEPVVTSVEKIISDSSLFKHQVVQGDSTWKILEKTLDGNEQFKGMTEAQKTYVLSTMTNKALQHPENYGLGHEGAIHIGDKTDFSKLFENTKEVKSILNKAQETISPGSAQENSILTNNAKIADWVKENPNVKITNDKVAEILATKPKVEVIPEPVVPKTEVIPEPVIPVVEPEAPVEATPLEPAHPETIAETPPPEPVLEQPIPKSSPDDLLQQKQLKDEIAEARQQLQTLEANKGGLRTMFNDASEQGDVKAALTNGVNTFYDKHGVFGFGTIAGINTSEWRFMSKLPANKILEYYTHDATKSGLSAKIIEELSKSPKHDVFIKQVAGFIEQSNVKPFENENIEQFLERLTSFVLKNTPKTIIKR